MVHRHTHAHAQCARTARTQRRHAVRQAGVGVATKIDPSMVNVLCGYARRGRHLEQYSPLPPETLAAPLFWPERPLIGQRARAKNATEWDDLFLVFVTKTEKFSFSLGATITYMYTCARRDKESQRHSRQSKHSNPAHPRVTAPNSTFPQQHSCLPHAALAVRREPPSGSCRDAGHNCCWRCFGVLCRCCCCCCCCCTGSEDTHALRSLTHSTSHPHKPTHTPCSCTATTPLTLARCPVPQSSRRSFPCWREQQHSDKVSRGNHQHMAAASRADRPTEFVSLGHPSMHHPTRTTHQQPPHHTTPTTC